MTHRCSDAVSHQQLMSFVPEAPDWIIDWPAIWRLWPELPALDTCPQDPIHHAEGVVGTHTRMVVEALVSDAAWRSLCPDDRAGLFWAAVLHDVGKPAVTRHEEGGRLSSRGHSRIGAAMARHKLWEAAAPFQWREAICGIIANHQLPFWLIERDDPGRLAVQTSWRCRPDHVCLHAKADALGRISADQARILEAVELAKAQFEESDCLARPFPFANDESRVAFFEKEDRDPFYRAYEGFRCQVIVMSGLPGSGKDTWIARNHPELPVVSLDAIREETGAPATGNQGHVIQAAYERAREHLRAKRGFVWNATNVTRQIRSKILRLLRDYEAQIRIVYVEVPAAQLHRQNLSRADPVPGKVLDHLAQKLEPPELWEAHQVTRVLGG